MNTPCQGSCPSGYSLSCGGERCEKGEMTQKWRNCEGKCIFYTTPCGGNCPDNTQICGTDRCLPQNKQQFYRACGDQCINKYSQCNGQCIEGYSPCGGYDCISNDLRDNYFTCNTECYEKNTEYTNYYFKLCGDSCLTINQFDDYYQCKGTCLNSSVPCDGLCPPGKLHYYRGRHFLIIIDSKEYELNNEISTFNPVYQDSIEEYSHLKAFSFLNQCALLTSFKTLCSSSIFWYKTYFLQEDKFARIYVMSSFHLIVLHHQLLVWVTLLQGVTPQLPQNHP